MAGKDYRNLIAWKKAFELALNIYEKTSNFPVEEKFGITAQIRKAGVSIPSNIAEGEGRKSRKEFQRFIYIALGSLMEVETQIPLSDALGYFKPNQAENLMARASEVGRLLNGLSKSL